MPHRRMTIKELAVYLHLSVADVERLVHEGEIPFARQGGRVVFTRKEVDAWASQRILGLSHGRLETYHKKSSVAVHDLSREHAIITELLKPEGIEPALASRTAASVLRDLTALAERTGLLVYPDELLASLREREALCSTALPGGLALVHPRHHDPYLFTDSFIVLGRASHPLPFGAPDGGMTDIFFLICCQDDRIHLHTLARLCMMCARTTMISELRAAEPDAMYDVIRRAEQQVIREL